MGQGGNKIRTLYFGYNLLRPDAAIQIANDDADGMTGSSPNEVERRDSRLCVSRHIIIRTETQHCNKRYIPQPDSAVLAGCNVRVKT